MANTSSVKALVFDTFGTVVDWRSSIIAEGPALAKGKNINIDWALFADRWRAAYAPSMDRVRKGELPWTKLDDLHRMSLEILLKEFKIEGLSEAEKDHWNKVWHRLKPWPDSVAGLTRLKKKYIIAPLSNGNVALLTDMAKHSGLPWDLILGAELARHYKPDREVYLSAAEFLGLKTEEGRWSRRTSATSERREASDWVDRFHSPPERVRTHANRRQSEPGRLRCCVERHVGPGREARGVRSLN